MDLGEIRKFTGKFFKMVEERGGINVGKKSKVAGKRRGGSNKQRTVG
jgi:hypothetical protein